MADPGKRAAAEAHRLRDENWTLGCIYLCRDDPRVFVRNRWVVGWTWNFGHRLVFPAMLASIGLIVGPAVWFLSRGEGPLGFTAFFVGLIALVFVAHRIASGPAG